MSFPCIFPLNSNTAIQNTNKVSSRNEMEILNLASLGSYIVEHMEDV